MQQELMTMPRPPEGYRSAAGEPIPGTHDIISRFKNSTALIQWAYRRGKLGGELYEKGTYEIGHCVHKMCEMALQGASDDDIDGFMERCLESYEDRMKATKAFAAFKSWRDQVHVRPVMQEVPLVSEKYQYGGTPDAIVTINNGLGLVDFKTSKGGRVYLDMLLAMAAHGQLWLENNPDQPLTAGYHLIVLPKDGGTPGHWHYPELDCYWYMYKLLLEAYRLDKLCSDPKALEGRPIPRKVPRGQSNPSPISEPTPLSNPKSVSEPENTSNPNKISEPETSRNPITTSVPPMPLIKPKQLSMAELLRAYNHVR
jgi:hypothetical protein